MTVDAIAAATGMKKANIKNLLMKMYHDGDVERVHKGVYRLPDPEPKFDI